MKLLIQSEPTKLRVDPTAQKPRKAGHCGHVSRARHCGHLIHCGHVVR